MSKWFVSEGHPDHGIVDDQGRLVAMVTTDEDNPQEPEQVLANAKLIASSPDLLVALKSVAAAHACIESCDMPEWLDAVEWAIAKAEGRGE